MGSVWRFVPTVLLSLSVASGCSERRDRDTQGDESTPQRVKMQRSSSESSDREIRVTIDSDGRYTVEGQRCDIDLLEDTLRKLKGKGHSPSVHILCGSTSEFKLVQQVIDPAMRLAMWTIRLQTSPGQEPTAFSRICAGPWDRPVLHVRVFPQRVTVNGADSSLSLLNALLRDNPEEYAAFIRPQEGATVGRVYSAFRTCETNAVEFGLVEEEQDGEATGVP